MQTLTFSLPLRPPLADRAIAFIERQLARLGEARQRRLDEEAFRRLDDATLRDLGIVRGEFGSYWAETHDGATPRTRRRVRAGGLPPL